MGRDTIISARTAPTTFLAAADHLHRDPPRRGRHLSYAATSLGRDRHPGGQQCGGNRQRRRHRHRYLSASRRDRRVGQRILTATPRPIPRRGLGTIRLPAVSLRRDRGVRQRRAARRHALRRIGVHPPFAYPMGTLVNGLGAARDSARTRCPPMTRQSVRELTRCSREEYVWGATYTGLNINTTAT